MNRASRDHLCRPAGPAKNAVSATSAKASDGVCVRRHSMCEHFTRMWTQYVQMMPTTNVAAKLNHRPPLAKANGIASMPEPSEPFNRWINVSPSLHTGCGWRCALVFVFRARIERKTYDFNIYNRILFSNKKKLVIRLRRRVGDFSVLERIVITRFFVTGKLHQRKRWTQCWAGHSLYVIHF